MVLAIHLGPDRDLVTRIETGAVFDGRLELVADRAPIRRQCLLHHCPVGGVVHVTERVEIDRPERPRPAIEHLGARELRVGLPSADLATGSRRTVDVQELIGELHRSAGRRVDTDPQRCHVVASASVTDDSQSTFGPSPPEPRAERRELDRLAEDRRPSLGHRRATHDPSELGIEPGIGGVIVGHVLRVAGQCVESDSTGRGDIAQSNLSAAGERPRRS